MTEQEIEALKELISDFGWEVLVTRLRTKRSQAMESLLTAQDLDTIRQYQERVRAFDYVMKLPHELIQGGKYAKS